MEHKKVIWKYAIELDREKSFFIPCNSEILTVQNQRENICIWVLIHNIKSDLQKRTFVVIQTGAYINPDVELNYMGTVQFSDGRIIEHVFEKMN